MHSPYIRDERLAELLNEIATQGGLIEPDQERELLGFEVAHIVNAIKGYEYAAARLKEIEELVRGHRKAAELGEEMLRPKAREMMGEPGAKAVDPQGYWKASVVQGRESVKLLGPIEEVPAIFVKERIEASVNHELAKARLEAGDEILSTVTGLPILKLERTPSIRIVTTEAGKQAELEARVASVLPSATPVLQIVKGAK